MVIEININKEEIYKIIDNFILNNSKKNIEELSKYLNRKKREKYPDSKEKILDDLSKEVKEEDLKKILEFEKSDKFKLAFLFLFKMGLRVSEVSIININDIYENQLKIHNIKMNRKEIRTIPKIILKYLNKYIIKYKKEINENNGFIFFSENPVKKKNNYIDSNSIRNRLRKITLELEINKCYGISKDGRKLWLISTHSGRHSFCMRFYRKSNFDIEKTRIAMRLKKLDTLKHYLKEDLSEVNKLMLEI